MSCIYNQVQFQKEKKLIIWALIDLNSKINAMTPAYSKQLGFRTQKIDIKAQKIDESLFKIFKMVIASF